MLDLLIAEKTKLLILYDYAHSENSTHPAASTVASFCCLSKMLSFFNQGEYGLHIILHSPLLHISHEKTRHNVVGGFSVNQACPIVVDEPAGDLIAILHVNAEVLLQMPVEKILI